MLERRLQSPGAAGVGIEVDGSITDVGPRTARRRRSGDVFSPDDDGLAVGGHRRAGPHVVRTCLGGAQSPLQYGLLGPGVTDVGEDHRPVARLVDHGDRPVGGEGEAATPEPRTAGTVIGGSDIPRWGVELRLLGPHPSGLVHHEYSVGHRAGGLVADGAGDEGGGPVGGDGQGLAEVARRVVGGASGGGHDHGGGDPAGSGGGEDLHGTPVPGRHRSTAVLGERRAPVGGDQRGAVIGGDGHRGAEPPVVAVCPMPTSEAQPPGAWFGGTGVACSRDRPI